MTAEVSDRLREALERLDQAIDRLDACVAAKAEGDADSADGNSANAVIVERLDKLIARVELALAE